MGNRTSSRYIRRERRVAIYRRDAFRCVYCETNLIGKRTDEVTLDHLTPGDDHSNTNLVASCCACNYEKADRDHVTYCKTLPNGEAVLARLERQRHLPLDMKNVEKLVNEWYMGSDERKGPLGKDAAVLGSKRPDRAQVPKGNKRRCL